MRFPAEDVQSLLLTAPIVASADAVRSICSQPPCRPDTVMAVLLDARGRHVAWLLGLSGARNPAVSVTSGFMLRVRTG